MNGKREWRVKQSARAAGVFAKIRGVYFVLSFPYVNTVTFAQMAKQMRGTNKKSRAAAPKHMATTNPRAIGIFVGISPSGFQGSDLLGSESDRSTVENRAKSSETKIP